MQKGIKWAPGNAVQNDGDTFNTRSSPFLPKVIHRTQQGKTKKSWITQRRKTSSRQKNQQQEEQQAKFSATIHNGAEADPKLHNPNTTTTQMTGLGRHPCPTVTIMNPLLTLINDIHPQQPMREKSYDSPDSAAVFEVPHSNPHNSIQRQCKLPKDSTPPTMRAVRSFLISYQRLFRIQRID